MHGRGWTRIFACYEENLFKQAVFYGCFVLHRTTYSRWKNECADFTENLLHKHALKGWVEMQLTQSYTLSIIYINYMINHMLGFMVAPTPIAILVGKSKKKEYMLRPVWIFNGRAYWLSSSPFTQKNQSFQFSTPTTGMALCGPHNRVWNIPLISLSTQI